MLLQTRILMPALASIFALVGYAGPAAGAQVHKCQTKDGQTVYQEAPCEKTGSSGKKLDLKEPHGKGKTVGRVTGADGTVMSMSEAFQRRMDHKDYEGALAFATTEEQKSRARKAIEQKNTKCAGLSQKMNRTQADVRADNPRSRAAADQAASEYALHCR